MYSAFACLVCLHLRENAKHYKRGYAVSWRGRDVSITVQEPKHIGVKILTFLGHVTSSVIVSLTRSLTVMKVPG